MPGEDNDDAPAWAGSPFARVRMVGRDFAGGHLPIRSLQELTRYQALVLEAAEEAWLRAHPSEEQVPPDFAAQLDLVITDVEDGSAVSVLERPQDTVYAEFYDQGRDQLEREIDIAASEHPDIDEITLLGTEEFRYLGSSLREGERLEIATPETLTGDFGRVAEITPQTSHKIRNVLVRDLKLLSKPVRRSEVEWIVGRLIAINAERKNYTITTQSQGTINGKYREDEILDELKAVLDSSERAPVIRLLAELRFAGGELDRILDVYRVQVLEIDGQPWSQRFIELASLPRGWHEDNDDSVVVSFPALDGARAILTHVQSVGLPQPGIFPLEDGGISLEWASPRQVTTIEVSPDAEFTMFHLEQGDVPLHASTINLAEVVNFVDGAKL